VAGKSAPGFTCVIAYWVMFVVPVFALAAPSRASEGMRRLAWCLIGATFVILIGMRYEVGGDWFVYIERYDAAASTSLGEALRTSDPGYSVLNWLSARIGGDVYFVNLVAATIVMTGVISFARRQPLDWLALAVAVPYLLVVVAMGYSRQSIALGFELLALTALSDGRRMRFALLIICGALFHRTAIVLLPIAALATSEGRLWTGIWIAAMTLAAAQSLLNDQSQQQLWDNYVTVKMESQGAQIRVVMNAIPAIIFMLCRKRFGLQPAEEKLWTWIALLSLIMVGLVGFASTAVDRISLYLLPIQLFVFARLPLLSRSPDMQKIATVGIIGYYAAVMFVWLVYAVHSQYWVPYHMYPFVE
jgi:hypothetical protein